MEETCRGEQTLLKVKYQPEWDDGKGNRFCRYRDELDSLETRQKNIGQMLTMMQSLKNEGRVKKFLQLQKSKETSDEMLQKNEDEIGKNQNTLCNSEDYKTLVQTNEETLKMRVEIVDKMNELLKPSEYSSIYRELHHMEGIMARARAEWQEQQLKSRDTSHQNDANEEVAQDTVGPKSFVNRCNNEVTSLPEERGRRASKAHSKGNRTAVSSKSSNAKRVFLLELEAMKKQEEMDEQLAAKKFQAEIRKKPEEMNMRILAEELEIAKLEEENARAKRIAEKEMEIARAEGSRASTSLRSISPIPIQSDPFEKVPSWLNEIECEEKTTKFGEEVSRIALASEPIKPQHDPLSHTTQMPHLAAKTVQPTLVKDGTSASQFAPKAASAKMQMNKTVQQHVQFENFEQPNQPLLSNQMRIGTLPPSVAPSANYSAPRQSQFATTRNEAVSLPASLPKLKPAEFSGDPLEWPDWSGLFLSTVHIANIDTRVKMNHLKTLVTGKAKEVIAGLSFTGDM